MLARPSLLFRLTSLFAIAMVASLPIGQLLGKGKERYLAELANPDKPPEWMFGAVIAVICVHYLLYAGVFWWCSRPIPGDRPGRLRIFLLVVLAVLGLIMRFELLVVVAALIGYLAPSRKGALALAVLSVTFVGIAWVAWAIGDFEVSEELRGLPFGIAAVLTVLYILGWFFFAFGCGVLAASESSGRRRLERANAELLATRKMLAESSRIAERNRISRELHDSLGHHLVGLTLKLDVARQRAKGEVAVMLDQAHGVAKLLLTEIRGVVRTLRNGAPVDLRGALSTLVQGMPEPAVHLSYPDSLVVADDQTAHILFRSVQEIITNTTKHAHARNLWLTLSRVDGMLQLRARDDGRGANGFTPGAGLTGMRERVEEAGGEFRAGGVEGQGFTLDIRLPVGGVN